jgi:hypothetical protein
MATWQDITDLLTSQVREQHPYWNGADVDEKVTCILIRLACMDNGLLDKFRDGFIAGAEMVGKPITNIEADAIAHQLLNAIWDNRNVFIPDEAKLLSQGLEGAHGEHE